MLPMHGYLPWSSLAIVAAGLLSTGPMGILAQIASEAVCLPSFDSLNNSLGQSPCLVSAYLQGACTSGQFNVSALTADTHYTGPFTDQENACQCSTVTYNTLSACGLCQNRTIISWNSWNTNCTTVYPGVFLPDVPDGTAIPHWAFQDVTATDQFNLTLAELVGDSPEATPTHAQSTVTSTPTLDSSSSGGKSNSGAIAGGVIGGVVVAALIAAAIILCIRARRRRSQIPPSAQFAASQTSPPVSSAPFTNMTPYVPSMSQPRLYDPSDPSTFPASPPPATIRTGSSYVISDDPRYPAPSAHSVGRYSGMPEV